MTYVVTIIAAIMPVLGAAETGPVTDSHGVTHHACQTFGDPFDGTDTSPVFCPDGSSFGQ